MSFETEVQLSLNVPSSELRSARSAIEGGLGDVDVGTASAATGGGGAGQSQSRRMIRWARRRTTSLDSIVQLLESIEDDISGGGGGGGGLGMGGGFVGRATGVISGASLGGLAGGFSAGSLVKGGLAAGTLITGGVIAKNLVEGKLKASDVITPLNTLGDIITGPVPLPNLIKTGVGIGTFIAGGVSIASLVTGTSITSLLSGAGTAGLTSLLGGAGALSIGTLLGGLGAAALAGLLGTVALDALLDDNQKTNPAEFMESISMNDIVKDKTVDMNLNATPVGYETWDQYFQNEIQPGGRDFDLNTPGDQPKPDWLQGQDVNEIGGGDGRQFQFNAGNTTINIQAEDYEAALEKFRQEQEQELQKLRDEVVRATGNNTTVGGR